MADLVACEHCGKSTPRPQAFIEVADAWPRYFCSERCKIVWGEQAEIEAEEED